MVETTLPANVPFFYKKKGKYTMLAIEGIQVGDEVEYIYTIKRQWDIKPDLYYNTQKISFTNNFFCKEKSVFLNSTKNKYEYKITPYNFSDGKNFNSNFKYENGYKITLNNIQKITREWFSSKYYTDPYIFIHTARQIEKNKISWEELITDFNNKKALGKKAKIFDGLSPDKIAKKISEIKGIDKKLAFVLQKMNQPLEDNYYTFEENIEGDIEVIWSYAQGFARICKQIEYPINIHLVVDKNYGQLKKEIISTYQFDAIYISYKNEKGKTNYIPVMLPYSKINDIKTAHFNSECLTIHQNYKGKIDYTFEHLKTQKPVNSIEKKLDIYLNFIENDSLTLDITDHVIFNKEAWINIRPQIRSIIEDTVYAKKRWYYLVENSLINHEPLDSIEDIQYSYTDSTFKISYSYTIGIPVEKHISLLSFKLKNFVYSSYKIPYAMRNKRLLKGYLIDEPMVSYSFNFSGDQQFKWIENDQFSIQLDNPLASFSSTYQKKYGLLNTQATMQYKTESFEPSEWGNIRSVNDKMNFYLQQNIYFRYK